jgi:anti-sigma factor RsiW
MTCRELIDFIADHLAGDLDPAARRTFDDHLRGCPECVAYLQSYETTVRLVRETGAEPDEPVPAGVPEALVRAVHAARARR